VRISALIFLNLGARLLGQFHSLRGWWLLQRLAGKLAWAGW